MTATKPPRVGNRIAARHSEREVFEAVRVISKHVNPADPADVSQNAFDAARTKCGYADLPRALSISQRFGTPWRTLLAAVHDPRRSVGRTVGTASSDHGRKGFTLGQVKNAVRLVARRLGRSDIARGEYEHERERMLAADRRAYRHGRRLSAAVPTLNQIDEVLRQRRLTWQELLASADLAAPAPGSRGRRGLTWEEAVRSFAAETETLPRFFKHLRIWCGSKGESLADGTTAHILPICETVNAERVRAGQAALPFTAVGDKPAGVPGPTGALRPKPRTGWDKERIIEGLVVAFEKLGTTKDLDQRSLKALAREHPELDIPSYSVVQRAAKKADESFPEWRKEALRRYSSRAKKR